jgi:hypothetical protein
MQPPRRNDLDRAEHRHTINTAGTAARPAAHLSAPLRPMPGNGKVVSVQGLSLDPWMGSGKRGGSGR